jgi:hypothetical protein
MLNYLEGRASDRKLMLFSAACLRRIWPLITDDRSRKLVEATERFLDGRATEEEACGAYETFYLASQNGEVQDGAGGNTHEAVECVAQGGTGAALAAASGVAEAVGYVAAQSIPGVIPDGWSPAKTESWTAAAKAERGAQAALLRDIFGPLSFRPLLTLPPFVLAWNDGCVVRLATAAYADRSLPDGTLDNQGVSVLADALEEAGLTDAELLRHLRGPGLHYRGCFALDLILGRQ